MTLRLHPDRSGGGEDGSRDDPGGYGAEFLDFVRRTESAH